MMRKWVKMLLAISVIALIALANICPGSWGLWVGGMFFLLMWVVGPLILVFVESYPSYILLVPLVVIALIVFLEGLSFLSFLLVPLVVIVLGLLVFWGVWYFLLGGR